MEVLGRLRTHFFLITQRYIIGKINQFVPNISIIAGFFVFPVHL